MKKGLIINEDRWGLIERLEPEDQSVLLMALSAYHRGYEVPEMDRIVEMVFSQICEDNAKFDPEHRRAVSEVRSASVQKRWQKSEEDTNYTNDTNEYKQYKSAQDKEKDEDEDEDKESPNGDKEKAPTGPKRKAAPFAELFADAPDLNQDFVCEAWEAWKEVRRRKKAPWTADAAVLSAKNLKKLSRGDPIRAVKILEQSTERGWQGLFELKEQTSKGKALDWDSVVV